MTEFMSRETIKEKIDEISKKFFDFQIVNADVHNEVENDMHNMISVLSVEIAKKGQLEDCWPMVISYMMDTMLAQLIVIKLQNKFIEEMKIEDE